jgi:hypothetical protein
MQIFRSTQLPLLTEPAEQTVKGVLESAMSLANGTAKLLVDVWSTRRTSPALLTQPPSQWGGGAGPASGFTGYKPQSFSAKADLYTVNPDLVRRIMAAGAGKRLEQVQ